MAAPAPSANIERGAILGKTSIAGMDDLLKNSIGPQQVSPQPVIQFKLRLL